MPAAKPQTPQGPPQYLQLVHQLQTTTDHNHHAGWQNPGANLAQGGALQDHPNH